MAHRTLSQPAGLANPNGCADTLAQAYQEVLTVIVRLRADRYKVENPNSFRSHILSALASAEEDARSKGYNPEDTRLASFAVVAFLDESILNSQNPAFSEWLGRPLQEEMFGVHTAGEIYFRNIERLLKRGDSQALADLLEIYELCLLLGFRGRHSAGDVANLRAITASLTQKIRHIRGSSWPLQPSWTPPPEAARSSRSDPRVRYFFWAAAGSWILAIILFVIYKVVLTSAVSETIVAGSAARF
jgi:type VI secretion system protein ImpK